MVSKRSLYLLALVITLIVFDREVATQDDILTTLQTETGLPVTLESFRNWAGTVSLSGVYVFQPSSTEDIQSIVRVARKYDLKVRAVASALSWSDLFPDEGQILLDMSRFESGSTERTVINHATYYRQFATMTVTASVTLREANTFLLENGIAFMTGPIINNPTLIGMIGTGSHGSNFKEAGMSSYLVNVQVITGDAEVRDFDIDREPEFLKLYLSHLGMCGIITRATFRVSSYPLMKKFSDMDVSVKKVLFTADNLNKLFRDNEDVSVTWNVHSSLNNSQLLYLEDQGQLPEGDTWDPLQDTATVRVLEHYQQADSDIMKAVVNETTFPVTYALADGTVSNATLQYGFLPGVQQDGSVFQLFLPKVINTEFGFYVHKSIHSRSRTALNTVISAMEDWVTTRGRVPLRAIKVSWWHHDPLCYLCHSAVASPSIDRDLDSDSDTTHVMSINMEYLIGDKIDAQSIIQKMFAAWKEADIVTLPHLAYHHNFLADVYTYLRKTLKPASRKFFKYRLEASVDSLDIFTNNYLDWVFQLDEDPSGTAGGDDEEEDEGSGARRAGVVGSVLAVWGVVMLIRL